MIQMFILPTYNNNIYIDMIPMVYKFIIHMYAWQDYRKMSNVIGTADPEVNIFPLLRRMYMSN